MSSDSIIMHNAIYSGCAEGIFMMQTGHTMVYYNFIHSNFEGIVVYEGSGDIRYNEIS